MEEEVIKIDSVLKKQVTCQICEKNQKDKDFEVSRLTRIGWICKKCYPSYKKVADKLIKSIKESLKKSILRNVDNI